MAVSETLFADAVALADSVIVPPPEKFIDVPVAVVIAAWLIVTVEPETLVTYVPARNAGPVTDMPAMTPVVLATDEIVMVAFTLPVVFRLNVPFTQDLT